MFSLTPHIKPIKNNKIIKNIKSPISKIIAEKLFSDQSHGIQMALNNNKMIDINFRINRAKPKINLSKIKNESPLKFSKTFKVKIKNETPTKNKKEIAFELADILDNSEIKFSKISEYYNQIKENNDNFLHYWQSVKKSRERNKKKLVKEMKNFCKNNNISEEKYKSLCNEFNFSPIDELELNKQKKISKNIFRSNPLMLTNEKDMVFYFLSKSPGNKTKMDEDNPTKFLIKLKDLLNFLKISKENIINDKDKEQLNSYYIDKHAKLLEEEEINNLNKEKNEEILKLEEAKKMIKETKLSLNKLKNNKNYFEDPDFFTQTMYNNRSKTQNKFYIIYKNRKNNFLNNSKLNNASLTTYFQDKSKNSNSKDSFQISNYNKEKKDEIQKFDNNYNDNIKPQKFRKIISKFNEKINNLNILAKKYVRNSFEINKINNIKSSKNLEIKRQSKNEDKEFNYTEKHLPKVSSNIFTPLPKSPKAFQSYRDESNIKKHSKISLFENLKTKKIKFQKQPKIYEIYNKIKNNGEISETNYRKINIYYKGRDLEAKNKKNAVEIINDIKLISDDFNINKLNNPLIGEKQIQLFKKFRKTNSELNNLDKDYVRAICQYRAKNERNEV